MYGGFLISYNKLKPFTYAAFYLSPFSWAVRSMADSEFRDARYSGAGAVYEGVFGLQDNDGWVYSGPWVLLGACYLGAGLLLCAAALSLIPPQRVNGTQRVPPSSSGGGLSPSTSSAQLAAPPAAVATVRQVSAGSAAALPFRAVTLAWSGVEYDVMNPRTKSTIQLLHDVAGVAVPGTLTALMVRDVRAAARGARTWRVRRERVPLPARDPHNRPHAPTTHPPTHQGASGAGKTTLMDVLAGRKTQGVIRGTIHVNGATLSPGAFARVSAYVEQTDIHLGTSTVAEALAFSAALRLESSVTPEQRAAFLAALLDELELAPLAGRVAASLAPGEQKRLSLGVELASNPSLLFLDVRAPGLGLGLRFGPATAARVAPHCG